MLRRLKDVALPFIQATEVDQVLDTLDAVVSPASVRLIGVLPRHLLKGEENVVGKVLYHSAVSAEYREGIKSEHERRGGTSVISHYARRRPPPFTLTEVMRHLQPTGDDRWVFDFLRGYGIRDGFHCTYWPWSVFYGADHVLKPSEFAGQMRMALYAAGSMAVSRMKEISANSTPATHATLSPREVHAVVIAVRSRLI
jgi:hypothetical protein